MFAFARLALFFTLSAVCFSTFAQNEETNSQKQAPADPTEEDKSLLNKAKEGGSKLLESGEKEAAHLSNQINNTQSLRKNSKHHLLGTYSLIDTWIPSKWGVTYAYSPTEQGSWEIEYLRGKIAVPFIIDDLGAITEQRLSLLYRSYEQRNSFNFHYGVNYSSFKLQLGTTTLATITSGNVGQYDLVSVESLGITWGIGNRWQLTGGTTIGLDWFTIYIPIMNLESDASFLTANASQDSKDDVRDILDIVEKLPTFSIFKFQLGFSF